MEEDRVELYAFVSSTSRSILALTDGSTQMVLGHDGNRHRLDLAAQSAIQCKVDILAICRRVLSEHSPVHHFHPHLNTAVYHVRRTMVRNGPPPCAITLSWYATDFHQTIQFDD